MFSSLANLVSLASVVTYAAASPLFGQWSAGYFQASTALNVINDCGQTIGTVHVGGVNEVATVTPGCGTTFFISGAQLYADIPEEPHAYANFANFGTQGCADDGALVFALTNSNKCAADRPFAVTSQGEVVLGNGGSFQVCGADRHLAFDKAATPADGCVNVGLWAAV